MWPGSSGGRDPQEVFGRGGLVDELRQALSGRLLNAKPDEHREGERQEGRWDLSGRRNGSSQKDGAEGTSKLTLDMPRNRAGTFAPKLIARYQRRFPDFGGTILSMDARGMRMREIRGHLEELCGIEVSPDLVRAVTDAVPEQVAAWQGRPLDACRPLVFLDALRGKIRDEGIARSKAVLHRARHSARWHQGDPGPVDRAGRGRQVPAARHGRAEGPGHR